MGRIGRYEILEELGRGAMGVVYKARDPQIGRIVAIKTILTAGLEPTQLSQYKSRFYREAQAAGRVSHPGIVTIHDIAEDEQGQPYLVMEFIEGVTLQGMLGPAGIDRPPEPIPLDRALDLGARIAEALHHAHRHGVVHRDIKPANILVTPEGHTKIADFGIARLNDTDTTRSSAVLGTPAYMPPEQLRGDPVDARSDIFSLGAILYRLVTGNKPFPGEDLTSVSLQVLHSDPARPSEVRPDLPRDMDIVISRCLAKNPKDRYPRAINLVNDLKAIRSGKSIAAAPHKVDDTMLATMSVATAAMSGRTPASRTRMLDFSARLRKMNPWMVATCALVLLLAGAGLFWRKAEQETDTRSQSAPQSIGVRRASRLEAPTVIELSDKHEPTAELASVEETLPTASAPPPTLVPTPRPRKPKKEEAVSQAYLVADVADDTRRAHAETVAVPAEAPPRPAAVPRASIAKSIPKPDPAVPTSELHFELKHKFQNATMRISSGAREIVVTRLEKRGGWIRPSGTKVETNTPLLVPIGHQRLRVHVKSADAEDPFDQVAFIEGNFPGGVSRRLMIEFPDGFLRLRWAD